MCKIYNVFFSLFCSILFTLLLAGCSERPTTALHNSSANQETSSIVSAKADPPYIQNSFIARYTRELQAQFESYYNHPIKFTTEQHSPGYRIVVIQNSYAFFYPGAKVAVVNDLSKIKNSVAIPLGTIVPVFATIKNPDHPKGLFFFNNTYNYFYETEWKGKRGLVYGADCFGADKSPLEVMIAASLYTGNAKASGLAPFAGMNKLPEAIIGQISDIGIGWEKANYQSILHADAAGPMLLALYEALAKNILNGQDVSPLFITTDLISETFSLLYNRAKNVSEATIMLPTLHRFIAESVKFFKAQNPKQPQIKKINDRVINFFLVADALYALLPHSTVEFDTYDNKDIIKIINISHEKILSGYPDTVQKDVNNILNAKSEWFSEILNRPVEHTFFTVGQLQKLSNTTVTGTNTTISNLYNGAIVYRLILAWLSEAFIQVADSASADDTVYYENAGFIVYMLSGIGDNINLDQALNELAQMEIVPGEHFYAQTPSALVNFLKKEKLVPLSSWILDKAKIQSALTAIKKNAPELITSQWSAHSGYAYTKRVLSLISSESSMITSWLEQVSHPQLENRYSVSGLDILACITDIGVFASPLYTQYPLLKEKHAAIRTSIVSNSTNTMPGVNTTDSLITLLFSDARHQSQVPTYADSPGWYMKRSVSSLTMLPLLNSNANIQIPLTGVSSSSPTNKEEASFTIEPLPQPEHWLEPAPDYYTALGKALEFILVFQKQHSPTASGLLADIQRSAFDKAAAVYSEFIAFTNRLADISQKELAGITLTKEEQQFILEIPFTLTMLLERLPILNDYTGFSSAVMIEEQTTTGTTISSVIYTDEKKNLFIPSYYLLYYNNTNTNLTELFSAAGLPFILYIPVQTPDGNEFIATGFMYSYAEFTQDVGGLTHEEWRNIVLSREAHSYELPWE